MTLRFFLLATALVLSLSETALACPGCKEAVASQKGGANIVAGYQWSIMFMMAMPFTILGLFCGYMYWEVKKAHAEQEARKAQQAKAQGASTADVGQKELAETAG